MLEQEHGYRYDGDDPDGETQAKLDSGEYVAFNSCVMVLLDGDVIAQDWLCGSVYDADNVNEFWTSHRDPDPGNRNCTLMRAYRGGNVSICHYFPDMIRSAVKEARQHVLGMEPVPYIRTRKCPQDGNLLSEDGVCGFCGNKPS